MENRGKSLRKCYLDCNKVLFRIGPNKNVSLKIRGYSDLKGSFKKLEWALGKKQHGNFVMFKIDPHKNLFFDGTAGGRFVGENNFREILNLIIGDLIKVKDFRKNKYYPSSFKRQRNLLNNYTLGVRYKGKRDSFARELDQLVRDVNINIETIVGTRGLILPPGYYRHFLKDKNFDILLTPKKMLNVQK